jgi:hypothetical protein
MNEKFLKLFTMIKNIRFVSGKILSDLFLMLAVLTLSQDLTTEAQTVSPKSTFTSYSFPLRRSESSGRYLTDQNNKPFFWLGDAAWSLMAQLTIRDVDYYLDDRKEKGFSVILVSLIEHKFAANAPANIYKQLPFIGAPFSTPNPRYFEHADSVIRSAAERNILVLLAPLYLGYDCKDEGWCAEVKAASAGDLYNWGKYVGERYRNFDNILWVIGGDTDPSVEKNKILEMIRGILENDTVHLFSAHNQPETMAVTPWQGETWLTVNNVYSYDSILYRHFKSAYSLTPSIPFYLCESAYENEHNSAPAQLRSQAYQSVLSGSMGHIFGNCPIWHFGAVEKWCNLNNWKTELNNAGSVGMDYFQRLFRSRSWQTLIPDFENKIITAGFGTWGLTDYVTTAITKGGNTVISYLPSGRSVTVDLGKVSGRKARCWWYDPSSGKSFGIGTFKTSGYHIFTPATVADWLLVIDNASLNLKEPGQ